MNSVAMGKTWRVFSGSAIGKSHIDRGLPCQDANRFTICDDVLIAVVCDGAGSAKSSDLGSSKCSEYVIERIRKRLTDSHGTSNFGSILEKLGIQQSACSHPNLHQCLVPHIKEIISEARDDLLEFANSNKIEPRDLYCTLVGVVADSSGGFFFHIGDGLGIAQNESKAIVVSSPENGEYSNETFFVTSDDWERHVRVTPFEGEGWTDVALMSDGAMPFVMNSDHSDFYHPFMQPVRNYLEQQAEDDLGSQALLATLASEKTYSITSDDKTLLIAILR